MIAAELNGTTVVNTIIVDEVPEGHVACPEWVGIGMDINTPQPPAPAPEDPLAKLQAFLKANPDVASLIA